MYNVVVYNAPRYRSYKKYNSFFFFVSRGEGGSGAKTTRILYSGWVAVVFSRPLAPLSLPYYRHMSVWMGDCEVVRTKGGRAPVAQE